MFAVITAASAMSGSMDKECSPSEALVRKEQQRMNAHVNGLLSAQRHRRLEMEQEAAGQIAKQEEHQRMDEHINALLSAENQRRLETSNQAVTDPIQQRKSKQMPPAKDGASTMNSYRRSHRPAHTTRAGGTDSTVVVVEGKKPEGTKQSLAH